MVHKFTLHYIEKSLIDFFSLTSKLIKLHRNDCYMTVLKIVKMVPVGLIKRRSRGRKCVSNVQFSNYDQILSKNTRPRAFIFVV